MTSRLMSSDVLFRPHSLPMLKAAPRRPTQLLPQCRASPWILYSIPKPDREPANQLHVIPEGHSIRSGSVTPIVPENSLDSTPGCAVQE